MTEYELTDVVMSRFGLMTEQASLYFALVSGYLFVAWMVGARLSRFQVSVINGLYVIWIASITQGYISAASAVVDLESAINRIGSVSSDPIDTYYGTYAFAVVQIVGLIASLFFMWSVRHPRDE
jgi:hypothetical protein